MAVVSGVLGDHVDIHPPQRESARLVVEREVYNQVASGSDLTLVEGQIVLPRLRNRLVEVQVRVLSTDVQRRQVESPDDHAEPPAFHPRQVPDQAVQRQFAVQGRRRQLLCAEVLALLQQRRTVEIEELFEHGALIGKRIWDVSHEINLSRHCSIQSR